MDITIIQDLDPSRWQEYRNLHIYAATVFPYELGTSLQNAEKIPDLVWSNQLDRSNYNRIFFAEHGTKLIGCITIEIWKEWSEAKAYGKRCGSLSYIFVSPDYQNQGIGQRLITEAIQYCVTRSCYQLKLELEVHNKARALYERLGFTISETSSYFMPTVQEKRPTYIMHKML